jgi:cytochrome P450
MQPDATIRGVNSAPISDTSLIAVRVLTALSLAYFTYVTWQWYRLSHIPGPFWASISKFWMVRHSLRGNLAFEIQKVSDEHGSLARVGPNELVTNDPDVLRKMMAVRSEYTRGPWYNAVKFEPGKDNLLSMRDEVAHTKLRNKMAAGYSGKENESLEGTIDEQVAAFIQLIDTKYLSTPEDYRPMDLAQKTQYFTLDVISALAFGHPFGYLKKDVDLYDYIKITESYIPIMMVLANVPWLADLLHSRFFSGLLPKESDKIGFGAFIGVAKRVVAKRFASSSPQQFDMLESFRRHGLTAEEVSSEVLLQVVAGSDTSATTIRAAMLHLLANPPAYKRLQTEIDDGIKSGMISSPIKDTEARQLPYLQAVIKEGLRILPPATGVMFRMVPSGGDIVAGKFVPAGTQIGTSHLALQHSKAIFGADAGLFRPERWLEASADPTRLAEMTNTVDLVFHYGKYRCLGSNVAYMEFNKVFVELLRVFDFSIVHPEKAAKISNAGIWIMEDFWVRVTRRAS